MTNKPCVIVNLEAFDKIAGGLLNLAAKIRNAKRAEYTIGDVDVLHNFRHVAARTGCTPEQVILTYMLKHIDSLTYVFSGRGESSEPIQERFADALNYLLMLYCEHISGFLVEPPPVKDNVIGGPERFIRKPSDQV